MSRFSHYTTGDPEWDVLCEKALKEPMPEINWREQIVAMREQDKAETLAMNKEMPAPSMFNCYRYELTLLKLCLATGYTATDFRIPVEGGEIDARSYVPEKTHEDERFPLLLWTHGQHLLRWTEQ